MSARAALFLMLPALLCGCQDQQARRQNDQLERRVAALELELKALKADRPHVPNVQMVTDVTVQAAAQNCAVELARTLELYRQDSLEHRYPTRAELEFPDACKGQHLNWQALKNQTYHFQVLGQDGQTLVDEQEP